MTETDQKLDYSALHCFHTASAFSATPLLADKPGLRDEDVFVIFERE
jgi:hypothetical protein